MQDNTFLDQIWFFLNVWIQHPEYPGFSHSSFCHDTILPSSESIHQNLSSTHFCPFKFSANQIDDIQNKLSHAPGP